ncbi:MAG TPA: VOC family protein [Actinomycetota bacterium]|jgi:catechol 2,3-dioxygenase-like lactoylglutathione lyase family enzyme
MTVPARLGLVTLGVTDLARSAAFYEALGWERASSSIPGVIQWFQTADANLGLFPLDELAADAGVPPERGAFPGITLAINVSTPEEVAPALAAAEAAGATAVKPATQADWGGVSGYFADPDGYLWEVAYNPAFPLDEQGRLHIP